MPAELSSNGLTMTPPEPRPETAAGLPTRIPGTSFNEAANRTETSARSLLTPEAIKGALSAYQVGREGVEPGGLFTDRPIPVEPSFPEETDPETPDQGSAP